MMCKKVNIVLSFFLLLLGVMPSQQAMAFGYVVRHVMYENGEEQLLAVKEKQNLDIAKELHDEMVKQVGLTQQIRSSLGDTRVMYEKDRLIGTLQDYDTIMRTLLFIQTRDVSLLDEKKNKNFLSFKNFVKENQGSSGDLEEGEFVDPVEVIGSSLDTLPSLIIRQPNNKNAILGADDSALAGDVVGGRFFIHAYTDTEKKRVPSDVKNLVAAYRKSFANDVAVRSYILAAYARAYLAERASGNGIGRHLYGSDEIIDEQNDPWKDSLNIISGVSNIGSNFVSALKSKTQTATSSRKEYTFMTECSGGSNINDVKNCIWQKFSAGKGINASGDGVDAYTFSYTQKGKNDNRIPITSIRQQISLNTIMWIRAALEVSTLMVLTSAQLELEAALALASLDDDNYWINPADNLIWGTRECPFSSETEPKGAADDGTRWTQDCLSPQERGWLTPSFDWENVRYKHQSYITTGDYRKEGDDVGKGL